MDKSDTFSCLVRGGTSVLALNSANNRLIAAGQKNFQLFSIERIDDIEQFNEIHDFRNGTRLSTASRWCALQPKDVAWNPNDETVFATASGTNGYLYIWDANRLVIVKQLTIHNGIINRLQFHPKHSNVILTASQDGFAKLIDFRINDTGKVLTSFRHSSKEAFRDIDINLLNTDKFAAVINDQYFVPIWDIRQPVKPDFSVLTQDKVLSIAWNPHERSWLATGGTGSHDRRIRVWDAKSDDNQQKPLFTVYTFGQVLKLHWRPTCRYHIACFARNVDKRIHVWDVRRAYLPQASFSHHLNDVEDFLWRPNSDNIISVGVDKRLIHSHISSAVKSDQLVSLFSLNVTPKGSVHVSLPDINNKYVKALCAEQQISLPSSSLTNFFSHETVSTFLKWNKMITGESIMNYYSNSIYDNSVQLFHQFARRWIFGNGEKSSRALEYICDVNSIVADDLNRPDLKATWQVIKMLFTNYDGLHNYRIHSSKNSRSVTKGQRMSDSMSVHRRQGGRKLTSIDKQLQENRLYDELIDENRVKSKDKRALSDSKLEMVDVTNTYIARDALNDDLIFITPEDVLNSGNGDDPFYHNTLDIEIMRESFPMTLVSNETVPFSNSDGDDEDFSLDRINRQYPEVIMIDDDEQFGSDDEYENIDGDMQTSIHSIIPDGSDKFFTIDESYCPTMQNYPINFDDITRETLWYYIENNELQVAVHLLLALYPQLSEHKRIELFNGAHLQWIVMYIELLQKMGLFVKAKQVTKHCVENEGIPLEYNSSDYDGAIIFTAQAPTFKHFPSIASPPTSSTNKNLAPILKEFVCSICRIPCRCQFSFCGVCFHGGHIDHINQWFKTHGECPYGCGHRCRDVDSQNRRNTISQSVVS